MKAKKDISLEVLDWAALAGLWFYSKASATMRTFSTTSRQSLPTAITSTTSLDVVVASPVSQKRGEGAHHSLDDLYGFGSRSYTQQLANARQPEQPAGADQPDPAVPGRAAATGS
jgi:hypothetical protein